MAGTCDAMNGSISDTLAQFVAKTSFADLPPSTVLAAKRVVLDSTGVMLGASGLASDAAPFVDLARASGNGPCTILGTDHRVPAPAAALANGAFAHALDYEDAFELSPGHPNASLVPVLLALSQATGPVGGERFLTALAVGCDVSCRMALALRRPMEAGGWYPPPMLAGYGAVAGAANLLGLNASQVRAALSLMLCQATMPGEIKYSAGTQLRATREAFPAQAALNSALLARDGVKGFEEPLEGRAGFYALYAGGQYDPEELARDLGANFWIEHLTFKPWPSCRGTHAFVELALAMRQRPEFAPNKVAEVVAEIDAVHTMLFEPADARLKPSSAIEAKFSIPFTVALALDRGQVTLDDFDEAGLGDPAVLALASKVRAKMLADPPWPRGRGGALSIRMDSGEVVRTEAAHARGSPANPLPTAALVEKFIDCAGMARNPLAPAAAKELAEAILALESVEDVGALF